MAESLSRSLNKRSRSAFDSVPDIDDIVQSISLAPRARSDSSTSFPSHVVPEIRQCSFVGKFGCDWASSPFSSRFVAELKGNDSWVRDLSSKDSLSRAYVTVSNRCSPGLARSISFPLCKVEKASKRRAAIVSRYRPWSRESAREFRSIAKLSEKKDGGREGSSVTLTVEPLDSTSSVPVLLKVVEADATAPSSLHQACPTNTSENCLFDSTAQPVPENKAEKCISDVAGSEATSTVAARRQSCVSDDRCPPFGALSICGRRREMEDTFTAEPEFALLPCTVMRGCCSSDPCLSGSCVFHFFGVYDGHGGTQASSFCKDRLHVALTEEMTKSVETFREARHGDSSEWHSRWEGIMGACFLKMDKEVGGLCPNGGCGGPGSNPNCCANPIAPGNVGSTAVVAVIGPCQIIVANCGDSRAVLCSGGKAVPLSRDHKPDREDELSRIEAAGGRVIHWDCHRVGGLLAMSRAIGNRFLKQFVTADPEVKCLQRTSVDECLILASDGLWDVVSNDLACFVARKCLKSQRRKCAKDGKLGMENSPAGAAAGVLTKLALSRGSKDNITVIVIDLKTRHKWRCNLH